MFKHTIKYYDRIYGVLKDYAAEAETLNALIKSRLPNADSILDVACGTGEHIKYLVSEYGYTVDGIDLEEGFIEIAKSKYPQANFYQADMTDFDLGKQYDVVMCLFSSIGYVKTVEKTSATIRNFVEHLNPGGLIIIEPWLTPDKFVDGFYLHTVDDIDLKVARMSYSEKLGNISRMNFEYLIGVGDKIVRETETHDLGLLTTDEMVGCFEANGLKVEYDETGLMDRGLFLGRGSSTEY